MHKQRIRDIFLLGGFLLLFLLSLYMIPQLIIDNSIEGFFPKDNEVVVLNDENEEIFGSQDFIAVSMTSKYGSLLTGDNIALIAEISERIEGIDHVDDVISLSNIDYIIASEWGMEVVDLYSAELGEREALSEMKRRMADWKDVYERSLISEDERTTAVIVQINETELDDGQTAGGFIYSSIQEILTDYESTGLDFAILGSPVVVENLTTKLISDMKLLIPLCAVIILLIMYLTFHRVEGVVLPLLALSVSIVLTMGIMSALGIVFTMVSMLIPILLLVVGSAYGMHILAHFYNRIRQEQGFVPPEKITQLISEVLKEIRISVILAGLTTIAGFVSLITSPIGPFRSFALLTALGVAIALLTAFLIIPALLRLKYRNGAQADHFRRKEKSGTKNQMKETAATEENNEIFQILAKIVRHRKIPAALLAVALIGGTIAVIPEINTGASLMNFFPDSSEFVQNTDFFNKKMSGTGTVTVRFDAPQKGDILNPEFLNRVDEFSEYMKENHEHVTVAMSLVPQIKRMNKIMNMDSTPYAQPQEETGGGFGDFFSEDFGSETEDPVTNEIVKSEENEKGTGKSLDYTALTTLLESALLDAGFDPDAESVIRALMADENFNGESYNEIPTDPAKYGLETTEDLQNLLSQYLVLYSGEMDSIINDALEPDKMILTLTLNNEDSDTISAILKDTREYWDINTPQDWNYHVGGFATLINILDNLVIQSQIVSLIAALLMIFLFISLLYRSICAGAIGLIPVVTALSAIFLTLGITGFNLDTVTSMLASLTVGIGVDYAIHFISAYKREKSRGAADPLMAVYQTTGRTIFFNALSVATGVFALVLSNFIPMRQMGILFAVSMLAAGVSSLVFIPMVIEIINPRFLEKNGKDTNINNVSKRGKTA